MTDVAIFVPSMRGGGAERAMLKLAIALSRSGVSLDLVLAKAEGAYIEDIPDDIRVGDIVATVFQLDGEQGLRSLLTPHHRDRC